LINGIFKRNFRKGGLIYRERRRSASGVIRMYYILRIFDKKVVNELMKLFDIVTPQTRWELPS